MDLPRAPQPGRDPGADPPLRPGWALFGWVVPVVNLIVPYQIIENLAHASIWWSRTKPLVLAWWACTLASTLFGATAYIGKNLRYSQLPIDLGRREDFAAYVDHYRARAFAPVAPILLATIAAAYSRCSSS